MIFMIPGVQVGVFFGGKMEQNCQLSQEPLLAPGSEGSKVVFGGHVGPKLGAKLGPRGAREAFRRRLARGASKRPF